MKLQSKQRIGKRVRCVYDPARTPLQRLLLSGVISAQKQQELIEVAQALGSIRLFQQIEQLQQGMKKLFSLIEKEAVDVVLIEYPDRQVRFGFAYLLQAFAWRGVRLEVLEEPEKHEFAEMTADLLTIITVLSGRMYGHRATHVQECMTSRMKACLQEAEQTDGAS